ncbi:YfdX protein [Nitrosomonas sp. Nm51]|uniref:YfdX family protein n=1 Tax=Nitrosomonas sp. Nm51 TaxID=133720 RepID=UPI0008D4A79C|nr:YfdX family protein [Nitrosomonas sp. Nm51]SEQ90996.1 YfdX protein [Nitrosomonas sp. Nm51]
MLFRTLSLKMNLAMLSVALLSLPLCAADGKSIIKPNDPANSAAQAAQAKVDKIISEKQKQIIHEAADAIANTKKALAALEQDKQQKALSALEKAIGELEVALARDPDLALAAIDAQITIHDLYSTLEQIEQARKQAEDYLEDNKIQNARDILGGLASEVNISVVNIPLAIYPKAIRDAISLVDAGNTKKAKAVLRVALNSLVETRHIIPLPIIRAEENLDKAEALAEKKDRTEVEDISLTHFLDQARLQLTIAEALGYGSKDDYRMLYKHLDGIIEETEGGMPKSDLFNEIRNFLTDLAGSFTDKK